MCGLAVRRYLELGDTTLWNPSNEAARLFQRQVAVFELELELPSGIGPMENDECQLDPVAFEAFVDALPAQHRRAGHAVVPALSEGFTATVLVLAERAGVTVDRARLEATPDGPLADVQVSALTGMSEPADGGTRGTGLRERARQSARHMPR